MPTRVTVAEGPSLANPMLFPNTVMNGAATLQAFRREHPKLKILMLTACGDAPTTPARRASTSSPA